MIEKASADQMRGGTRPVAVRSRPVLSTPFRIGVAGAATLAATGLAAAELWQKNVCDGGARDQLSRRHEKKHAEVLV